MELNRFSLGVLIINILLVLVFFIFVILHPEKINVPTFLTISGLGIVSIMVNCFGAFKLNKKEEKQNG